MAYKQTHPLVSQDLNGLRIVLMCLCKTVKMEESAEEPPPNQRAKVPSMCCGAQRKPRLKVYLSRAAASITTSFYLIKTVMQLCSYMNCAKAFAE